MGIRMEETRREALGRFLRTRRESLMPAQAGIASHRGRRTPGLRREEVAFLADIGVKWYARLECGDDIHPSESTLTGIASALQLSDAELDYILELSGVRQPLMNHEEGNPTADAHLEALVHQAHGVSATIADRILTPLFWNGLSDAIYDHSRFKRPVERNALVRALVDPDMIAFLGADREDIIIRGAGMLRLDQASGSPSPFADEIYERVKDNPLFQQAWTRRTVANDEPQPNVMVRSHAEVGRLNMHAVTFGISTRTGLVLRIVIAADNETARKFGQLEQIGKPQSRFAGASLRVCD